MKRLNLYLWNNFDNDDRVRKKAISLSKVFDINVYCVCKKPQDSNFKQFAKNIKVYYYWNTNFLFWLWARTIGNYWFWKKIVNTTETLDVDVVDCNDPDTLYAGVLIKKRRNVIKIMYDSHEYWKGTPRKEYNLYYTIYSYIVNYYQYLREKHLVHNVYKIICVSESIKQKLLLAYNKPTSIIFNLATYNNNNYPIKFKRICFFGSKPRAGIIKIGAYFKQNGIMPVMIGKPLNNQYWRDLGYLNKSQFQKEMSKCMYGLCMFDVTCDNIKYCMPNKLFEYIQARLPIVTNKGLMDVTEFVKLHNIGCILKNDSKEEMDRVILKLKVNYNLYLNNIRKLKGSVCWEQQESKLLEIYNF